MAYEVSFGQWMVNRRKELRLQRTELATQVGCASITLRKIESDERRPSQQLAGLLADRLRLLPPDQTTFVRVARGELPADRLPALPLKAAAVQPTPSIVPSPIRTNLPAPLTIFVGRQVESAEVIQLIAANRLVTLSGAGGVGKTRLATEVGLQLVKEAAATQFRDGIWIVELAAMAQPALIIQALARLFRMPEQVGQRTIDLLQEHLAQQQLLLIVDNCEHVIETCAEIVEQLLHHCWQLHILATSREELRVPGEAVYSVQPLTLPSPLEHKPEQILASAAATLFIDRIGISRAKLMDSVEDTHAIASICRQLEGIPLALELAAPLTRSLTLAQIDSQLSNQMAILTNSYRTAIPRHQTMHSALVWSYRLLSPAEQLLLMRVSVFAGGWNLAAAQSLYGDLPAEGMARSLQQLTSKSLVLVAEQGDERRYRLLEPVRQFAHSQLVASGELELIRRRHASYFFGMAQQMGQARDTLREREWLDRLEPERANLHAVNDWAIEHGESEFAHNFNGMLFAFWIYRNSSVESHHWIEQALALQAPAHDIRALTAEALALDAAAYIRVREGDYISGRRLFERELVIHTTINNQPGIATALRGCGFVAMLCADLAQAQSYTGQSLSVSRAVQDRWGAAWSLFDLGYLALVRDEYELAQTLLNQAVIELHDQGILFGTFRALIALGHTMRFMGSDQRATEWYYKALNIQRQLHYVQVVSDALEGLAGLAATKGHGIRAAQLFGAAQASNEAFGMQRWPHLNSICERDLAHARSLLSPAQWSAAWQAGHAMTLDEAVAYALHIPHRPGHA